MLLLVILLLIVFFVFDNQIDLLVQAAEKHAHITIEQALSIIDNSPMPNDTQQNARYHIELEKQLDHSFSTYAIYNESNQTLISKGDLDFSNTEIFLNLQRALVNYQILNRSYLSQINTDNYLMDVYIPIVGQESLILYYQIPLLFIGTFYKWLYDLLFVISIFTLFFFILFNIYIFKTIIHPIIRLKNVAKLIASGQYGERVDLPHSLELKELAIAFNNMADSTEETIEGLNEEITTRIQIEKELWDLSKTDHKTKLYNHMFFDENLEIEISKLHRYQSRFCVIYLDINKLKKINDVFGYEVGDSLITEFSQLMRANFRFSDKKFRLKGGLFSIILSETSLDDGLYATNKIKESIETHNFSIVENITANFAVVEFLTSDNKNNFLEKLELCMKQSKLQGLGAITTNLDLDKGIL